MSRVAEIVQAIISEDAVAASELIREELGARAMERIEEIRIAVASDMFSEASCNSGKRQQINGEYDELEDEDDDLDEAIGPLMKVGGSMIKHYGKQAAKAGAGYVKKGATSYVKSGAVGDIAHNVVKSGLVGAAGVTGAVAAQRALRHLDDDGKV